MKPIFTISLLFFVLSIAVFAQRDFDHVKQRVVAGILESKANDEQVAMLMETMEDDGSWPGINYEDVSNTGFENRIHTGNMIEMSLAFKQKGSQFYQDKKLAKLLKPELEELT